MFHLLLVAPIHANQRPQTVLECYTTRKELSLSLKMNQVTQLRILGVRLFLMTCFLECLLLCFMHFENQFLYVIFAHGYMRIINPAGI